MAFPCGLIHAARRKFLEVAPSHDVAELRFQQWVRTEFFENTYAFEILMAPHILGQLRIQMTLEGLGVDLGDNPPRLKTLLANTLVDPIHYHTLNDYAPISNPNIREIYTEALEIRDQSDIFVIMGNPPYNESSQNNSPWIMSLIDDYRQGLECRNTKILADDYVKFLRFAEHKIQEVGLGIVAFITNNAFLDGHVYKVMREHLRRTFDHIYVVNLLGNMRRNEQGNVFGKTIGISIAFMVRSPDHSDEPCPIHYAEVAADTLAGKFEFLAQAFGPHLFETLPETENAYFLQVQSEGLDQWQQFVPLPDLFRWKTSSGIMIGRDALLVNVDRPPLEENLRLFFANDLDALQRRGVSIKPTKSWNPDTVRQKTSLTGAIAAITPMAYAGFDRRFLAYDDALVEGHRRTTVGTISPTNPAITVTSFSRRAEFSTAFITDLPYEKCYMAKTDSAFCFTLYTNNQSNLITDEFPPAMSPEEVFYYIYAVLWTPRYRSTFNGFLVKEYPRIPVPTDVARARQLAVLGLQLAHIHTLLPEILDVAPYRVDGTELRVGKVDFDAAARQVTLDAGNPQSARIQGISSDMWSFEIGGVPQLKRWLENRKFSATPKKNTLGRPLGPEDLQAFAGVCAAVRQTLDLLPALDAAADGLF
jgi:predicted helicase